MKRILQKRSRPLGSSRLYLLASLALALALTPIQCAAQDAPDFHRFTVDGGGGITHYSGKNASSSLQSGYNFRFGGGVAVTPDPHRPSGFSDRPWDIYITGNVLYSHSNLTSSAVQQTILLNPQIPSLLSSTGAQESFTSTTFGPQLRWRPARRATVYGFAGFGALHRTLDFNGVSATGMIIQPGSATTTPFSATSGAFEFGGGLSGQPFKSIGISLFGEARYVQPLGVNSGIKLVPLSFGVRW